MQIDHRWLQTQPKSNPDPKKNKRDDYDWFQSVITSIVTWDDDPNSLIKEDLVTHKQVKSDK